MNDGRTILTSFREMINDRFFKKRKKKRKTNELEKLFLLNKRILQKIWTNRWKMNEQTEKKRTRPSQLVAKPIEALIKPHN